MPVKKRVTSKIKDTRNPSINLRASKMQETKSKKIVISSEARNLKIKVEKKPSTRGVSLSVPIYSLAGRAAGTMQLPKEIFGQKVNEKLLSQALRVYMTNQKSHTASTKTRGEVRGSTAKIYRQKGTGRARHGAITAPIFVGGGITFGPKPRKIRLDLPQKMKKAALFSALASKVSDSGILGISGLEKATGKTKEIAKLVYGLWFMVNGKHKEDKKQKNGSILIVTGEKIDNVVRGAGNIPGVSVLPADQINAYEVLKHNMLLITKEAVSKLGGKVTSNPFGKLRASE